MCDISLASFFNPFIALPIWFLSQIPKGLRLLTRMNFSPNMDNDYADYKMWDQIIYPYQNFDDATFEVWTWISNYIPHCSSHRLSMLGLKLNQCYWEA